MLNFYSLPLTDLKEKLSLLGRKPFFATQLYNWIYKNKVEDIDQWTNVSKDNKNFLKENFTFELPKILWNGLSKDGTRKFLVGFSDKQTTECVIIPAKNNRQTLCISSQIGCAIGCKFCHTGTMGFKRNLLVNEITGQFMALTFWMIKNADPEFSFSNIVFMGQGEPLQNMSNVKKSIEIFMTDIGLGLGQRRITLSTSGLVPQIKKLMDFPPINIAISLHAAHDEVRSELMPINQVYDLKRLFEAIAEIPLKAYRRITYEYILIKDFNDGIRDINGLCDLLTSKDSKINLIPFNEYPESGFKRPSQKTINWFRDELTTRGYVCTVRQTKGDDILAACGQLKSLGDELNLWEEKK